ncbi:diguanylate cyclase [Sulfurimonas sp. HSL1-6]|uniref:sensor domain-containing diguanylate cyclase n=1 Tax=Thiomicrolovo immobilis TaxID=3131935 RepID=UPI0031F88B92
MMIGIVTAIFYKAGTLHVRMEQEILDAKQMLVTADELRQTSDDLTHFARSYVVTKDPEFKHRYYTTLDIRNGMAPRPKGYARVYWDLSKEDRERKHPPGEKKSMDAIIAELPFSPEETAKLTTAEVNLNEIVKLEIEAINAAEGRFKDAEGRYTVRAEPDRQRAIALLHSKAYYEAKQKIMNPIDDFLSLLNDRIEGIFNALNAKFAFYEYLMFGVIIGFIFINLFIYRHLVKRNTLDRQKLEYLVEQRTQNLEASQSKLQEAQSLAHFGSWELNLETNGLTWSDEVYRMFEIDRDEYDVSYELFAHFIHPDDRSSVDRTYQESVSRHTPYRIEHRLLLRDGRVKYVLESGETFYDAKGTPVRSIGTIYDITDRKQYEQTLKDREALLSAVVEQSMDGIGLVDRSGHFVMVNNAYTELVGYSKSELSRMHVFDLLPPGQEPEMFPGIIRTRQPSRREKKLRRKDGTVFLAEISATPIMIGEEERVLGIVRDVTEYRRMERALEYSARHDALTGLYNRHVLEKQLSAEVGRAERYDHPLSLFMLDIDHFKKINDTYGHQIGDMALRKVADILKKTMRKTDMTARYGGEEFVIILPESSHDEAMELAQRLCGEIAGEHYMTGGEGEFFLTVSIGVASLSKSTGTPVKLLEAADAAMYAAKRSGRNRVVSA